MRVVLILIVTILILVGCGSNTNDEANNIDHNKFGTVSVDGCIQRVGDTVFLINRSTMLIRSGTFEISELIDGQNYRFKYTQILESNPPIINAESYKEISKNYCD